MKNEHGQAENFIAIGTDISTSVQTEANLRREAQARATLYSLLNARLGERSEPDRWRRLALWWRVTVARASHLTLPKFANRL